MNERIRELLAQMTTMEDEIEDILRARQEKVLYRLKDGKIRFKEDIEAAQQKFRKSVLPWLFDSRPANLLSAPFVYGMIIPFGIFDLCISLYQSVCFPLYRIKKVKRSNYIIIDRNHLQYLNSIERLNCVYCGYINGLLGYVREIAARTEQYWCPIKHAGKIIDKHSRYHSFVDFGDAEAYQSKLGGLQQLPGKNPEE
ncbi:MAG: hypothetical protein WD709_04075 [Gammaproteobacteria bacterium]